VNKLTNWEGFKEEITNTLQLSGPLMTIEQLDEEAENFMKIIQKAAWKNTLVLKRRMMGCNYSKETRELTVGKKESKEMLLTDKNTC
jgi:hypothetical protein